jgi:Zn2+/Cd2+-exporting ATPase
VPALQAAWRSLRYPDLHGITDQLIALAFIAAWAAGDLITATLLPLIMMVGHVLEERSLLGSQEAIRALTSLTQTVARRIHGEEVQEVNASELRVGDVIEIRAGDRIPADGVVLDRQFQHRHSLDHGRICSDRCEPRVGRFQRFDKLGRAPQGPREGRG